MEKVVFNKIANLCLILLLSALASACDSGAGRTESAAQAAVKSYPTPDGRIVTADQAGNTLSLVDVATNTTYGDIKTGQQPHHVVASPDGKELWVSLYGEKRLQIFDAVNLSEVASVDVGASNDDLIFDPAGKMLYVSLGKDNAVAVVDAASRKLVKKVPVGNTPHGVRTTPDGKYLFVTNTADNTVSLLTLQPEVAVKDLIKTGPNPFEVFVTPDSKTAYVSDFLGDSIAIIDVATAKTTGYMRTGKQPAMIALQTSGNTQHLWIANTGSSEVWVIDPATRKLVTRIPSGKGTHGVAISPSGKVFVTNTTDNTVTIIDEATQKPLGTIAVGSNPNGLTYVPNVRQ